MKHVSRDRMARVADRVYVGNNSDDLKETIANLVDIVLGRAELESASSVREFKVHYMITGDMNIEAASQDEASAKFNSMIPDKDDSSLHNFEGSTITVYGTSVPGESNVVDILSHLHPDGIQICQVEDPEGEEVPEGEAENSGFIPLL